MLMSLDTPQIENKEFTFEGLHSISIDWNHHEEHLLATAASNNCAIYDVERQTEVNTFSSQYSIKCVSWSKYNPGLLAFCSYDNNIFLWSTNEGINKFDVLDTESKVNMVAFSHTNENIIASSHESTVNVWDYRMLNKTPLKSHKTTTGLYSGTVNLEFDQLNGLLLA